MLKPLSKLIGKKGNIPNITNVVSRSLTREGQNNKIAELLKKVKSSTSYEEQLQILMEYAKVS